VQTDARGGHDAKASAAATQCPEQLLFSVVFGGNDAAVRENHVCGNYIVESQAKAANQRPIANGTVTNLTPRLCLKRTLHITCT
jgi:hypothetical protein